MRKLLLAFAIAGCSGDGAMQADDVGPGPEAGVDSPPGSEPTSGVFALTSPAFTEGGVIPDINTCKGNINQSPQLDWENKPAGTLSFALVLTDKSNNLIHSVFYDIPADRTGLPADVDKTFAPADVPGMHTTRTLGGGQNFGYSGPCPPNQHTYEFALFALDIATLPGLGMTSTQQDGKTAILMHDIGTTTLTGVFDPN